MRSFRNAMREGMARGCVLIATTLFSRAAAAFLCTVVGLNCSLAATTPTQERCVDDFGAKGDGRADDTDAINRALSGGGTVSFTSGKTYRVRGAKVHEQTGLAIPDHTHLKGNGATIKLLDHQDKEVWQPCLIRLVEKTGVTIEKLTIDGNRMNNNPPLEDGDGGGNNIQLEGARDIKLIGVISENASTDGLYVADGWSVSGGKKSPTDGLFCESSCFTGNSRQGLSVISLQNAEFVDCEFSKTSGLAPEAGVDFENNWPYQVIREIEFRGCRMLDNQTHGVVFAIRRNICAGNVTFVDCEFRGNGKQPISLRAMKEGGRMRDILFKGGKADGSYILIGTPGHDCAQLENIVFDGMQLGTDTWIRYDGAKHAGSEQSLVIRRMKFTPSDNPPESGMVVLNDCDGVLIEDQIFPNSRYAAVRLKGRVTALTVRNCLFQGMKKEKGFHGVFFIRAQDRNTKVDQAVRIQNTRFMETPWAALLLDGSGDWRIAGDVTFTDCRRAQVSESFTGMLIDDAGPYSEGKNRAVSRYSAGEAAGAPKPAAMDSLSSD